MKKISAAPTFKIGVRELTVAVSDLHRRIDDMNQKLDYKLHQAVERLDRRIDAAVARLDEEIEAMDPKWAAIDRRFVTDLVRRNADFNKIAEATEDRALNRFSVRNNRRLSRGLFERKK
ncbi:MAG: hypothetical protein NTY77_20450 [Elusimicrobia bacterium]|nr:hypothetical protein [Elusimicrobiota bacterium]